jgi:hypothetical protein
LRLEFRLFLGFALTSSQYGFLPPSWLAKFSFSCWKLGPNDLLHLQVSSSFHALSRPFGLGYHVILSSCPQSTLISVLSDILLCFLCLLLFCICLLTSVLFLLRIDWPGLPYPPTPFGIGNKRHCCVGCRQGLSVDPYVIRCSFSDSGFPFSDGSAAYPCYSAYHTTCFEAGPPFSSRRKDGSGLTFPKIKTWPNFICEACTVRSVLDRELTGPSDWKLVCFERMRVLDMSHHWSLGTHAKCQGKLAAVTQFETEFDLDRRILRPTPLLRPPAGADIGLMWMMELHYASWEDSRYSKGERTMKVKVKSCC